MCGCGGPEISETVRWTVNTLDSVTVTAAPAGTAIALIASILLLDGPRRLISIAMLALLFAAALVVLGFSNHLSNRVVSSIVGLSVIGFIGLGAIALTYWPSPSRWINWPLLAGIGLSSAALAARMYFPFF